MDCNYKDCRKEILKRRRPIKYMLEPLYSKVDRTGYIKKCNMKPVPLKDRKKL
jgi:hypothetical protein